VREVKIKGNETGLRVFVNGVPDFRSLSQDELKALAYSVTPVLRDHVSNYKKRKAREKPKEKKVSKNGDTSNKS